MKNGKHKPKSNGKPKPVDPAVQVRRIVKMLRTIVPPERRREVRAETLEKHIAELVQVSASLARARAAASVLKQIGL
jgi:hypothetical protein